MSDHHPLYVGPSSHKLRGVWVKHKTTQATGYVSYSTRNPGERPELWIIYPPGRLPNGTKIKTYSAGRAHADEVKRLKRPRKKV